MPKLGVSDVDAVYLGGSVVGKIYLGGSVIYTATTPPSAWTPADIGADLALWLDATDTGTITLNGSNVSQWDDKSDNQLAVTQSVADNQPAYTEGEKVTFDRVNDTMTVTMPATTGTLVLATANGTAAYGVSIPAGAYSIGGHGGGFMPDGPIIGQIITSTAMGEADKSNGIAWLREKGGGNNYETVTDFSNFWREWRELTSFPLLDTSNGTNFSVAWYNCTGLTSFPLIDTSSGTDFQYSWVNCTGLTSFPLIDTSNGTNFQYSWYKCSSLTSFPLIDTSSGTSFREAWNSCSSLTSFPLIDTSSGTDFREAWSGCTSLTSFPLLDTSSGTNFQAAWYGCTGLTSFPANFFDNCLATSFNTAFTNTNLSQQSIDNILVSIESNGTSNGTFNQSGGQGVSATGQAAINALRSRGWTVTVTEEWVDPTPTYDADAQAYFERVEAEDGQTLEPDVKTAINDFVVGCKADGIWDAIKASCILAGARTLSGALQPLVGAAPTNYNFIGDDYNRKTGLKGDGNTKYLVDNRPDNIDPVASVHASVYISVAATSNEIEWYYNNAVVTTELYRSISTLEAVNRGHFRIFSGEQSRDKFFGTSRNGILMSDAIFRFGGTNYEANSGSYDPSRTAASSQLFRRSNGTFYATARLSFYSIGEALDLAALDTRVSALMTAIDGAIA